MKLSYDTCLLCHSQLEMQVLDLSDNQVIISYICPTKITMYSEAKLKPEKASHCFIRTFAEGDIAVMIIFPYLLTYCFQVPGITKITKVFPDKQRKYLTTVPLLDIDFSKHQDIVERLDRLITFI